MSSPQCTDEQIEEAADLAYRYAGIDGAHHKQWVIDQMLQKLLGTGYDDWVLRWESEDEGSTWDKGIAP